MDNKNKAVGGLTILGTLALVIHLTHSIFNLYNYNQKQKSYQDFADVKSDSLIKSHSIENFDSILKIDNIEHRDSLLKEALKQSIKDNN